VTRAKVELEEGRSKILEPKREDPGKGKGSMKEDPRYASLEGEIPRT